jgi:hypothetical protein
MSVLLWGGCGLIIGLLAIVGAIFYQRHFRTLHAIQTSPPLMIPAKYVAWWLLIAFLLGTQWRVVLASFAVYS